jgi:hypothetical protein
VQHPAHIRLVDAHSERDRRRDDSSGAVEERRHRLVPGSGRQPCVVERHRMPGGREDVPRRLRAGVGRRVDDSRARELGCSALELAVLLVDRPDSPRRKLDVRTIEVPDHHLGLAERQAPADLLTHR